MINYKKIVLSATLIGSAAFGQVALAEGSAGSGPNPFSDCGIGAALFPTVPWAAVTSNIIWDVGTTAVTSATASPETCSGKNAQAAVFILETYDNLAEETARGEGDHVAALMNILEVNAELQASVVTQVRSDMAGIVSEASYVAMDKQAKAEAFYNAVMSAITAA